MRTLALATASAMALMSAATFAQTSPPAQPTGVVPVRPMGITPTIRPAAQQAPKPNPLDQADVSKIMGTAVYGSDGEDIGSVSTVLMKRDKKVDRLVVHAGGVLGVGGRHVALPLDQFSWNVQKGVLTISKTAKDLDQMAEWKPPMSNSVGAVTPEVRTTTPASHATVPGQAPHSTTK
jgi:sporulation protein YlmC with PRC-barrel domain